MQLSEEQKLIYETLKSIDARASSAYLGGLEVLDFDHKDRVHQSANSIRHALALITRTVSGGVKGPKEDQDSHRRNIRKIVDPLVGLPPKLDFQIKLLIDEHNRWFVKVAHYLIYPSEREYRRRLRAMEEVLLKVIRPHFDVIEQIDTILASEEPSLSAFTKLEELMARDLSCYDHFFQRASSDWLPFLTKKGHFDNPMHPIKEKEIVQYGFIAPSGYLARIAGERPAEVLRLIMANKVSKRKEERNPWVLENFVSAAIAMDVKRARKIAKRIAHEKWVEASNFSRIHDLVAELMVKLSNHKFHETACSLGHAIFDMTLSPDYAYGGLIGDIELRKNVIPVIDDYWYRELAKTKLPILAQNDAKSMIELVTSLLNKSIYLENVGRNQKNAVEDLSIAWRPAIEYNQQNYDFDFRTSLVDVLRAAIETQGARDTLILKKCIRLISKYKYPFFRRVILHAYRMFPDQFILEIESAIVTDFDKSEFRHEYFHLLNVAFPMISKKARMKYFQLVKNGPDEETIKMWKEYETAYPNETIDLKTRFWTFHKLEPIASSLEGQLKDDYQSYLKEFGPPEHPDFLAWHSKFQSAEPITNLAENLEPNDVVAFVKSYEFKDEVDFPFYDGTKQKFQEYVAKLPLAFSKLSGELKAADPIFCDALLSGLEIAVKSGKEISWDEPLRLCGEIIDAIQKEGYGQSKRYNVLDTIAYFLKGALESEKGPPVALRNAIWSLVESLMNLEKPEDSRKRDYPDTGRSSIEVAMNTTSGKNFLAVCRYASWCDRNRKGGDSPELVSEVKGKFDAYFAGKIDNTVYRHAIIGFQLPNLIHLDRPWMLKNLEKLFSQNDNLLFQAAWDAYLYNTVSESLFEELGSYYSIDVKNLHSPLLHEGKLSQHDQKLIDHVTAAYVHGLRGSDVQYAELMKTNSDPVLQHIAWTVSMILRQYKDHPWDSLRLDIIRSMWEEPRLSRQKEVDWWFAHSPFEKDETIDLFLASLKAANGEIGFASTIEKDLQAYMDEFPLKTAECLELILKSSKNRSTLYAVRRTTVKPLLQQLLRSKERKAVKKAEGLIHFLGTLGFNEFGELLGDSAPDFQPSKE